MPVAAHDDVVVDCHSKRPRNFRDLLRHLDVGTRRRRARIQERTRFLMSEGVTL